MKILQPTYKFTVAKTWETSKFQVLPFKMALAAVEKVELNGDQRNLKQIIKTLLVIQEGVNVRKQFLNPNLACRGLFPGCRRCVKHDDFSIIDDTSYHCGSCDEGMYLYPQKMTNSAGSSFIVNRCVPDCPTVNFQMVNNPLLGRCEFLGYFCMYGNAKEGCIKSYLQNGKEFNFNKLFRFDDFDTKERCWRKLYLW